MIISAMFRYFHYYENLIEWTVIGLVLFSLLPNKLLAAFFFSFNSSRLALRKSEHAQFWQQFASCLNEIEAERGTISGEVVHKIRGLLDKLNCATAMWLCLHFSFSTCTCLHWPICLHRKKYCEMSKCHFANVMWALHLLVTEWWLI